MISTKLEAPESYRDCLITYKDNITGEVVTKRGFYSLLFDNVSIPSEYQFFNIDGESVLLPHDFNGQRLKLNEVLNWEYCE